MSKRTFSVVFFHNGEKVESEKRFTGRKPKHAASRALTAFVNDLKSRGENTDHIAVNMMLREDDHYRTYYLTGSKYLLSKPVTLTLTKNGVQYTETYYRGSKIVPATMDDIKKMVGEDYFNENFNMEEDYTDTNGNPLEDPTMD